MIIRLWFLAIAWLLTEFRCLPLQNHSVEQEEVWEKVNKVRQPKTDLDSYSDFNVPESLEKSLCSYISSSFPEPPVIRGQWKKGVLVMWANVGGWRKVLLVIHVLWLLDVH